MLSFFKTIIYEPLYNLLVLIAGASPFIDAGIAIVALTLTVRFILFPLSKKAILTQQKLRVHQDELKDIRDKYKDDKQQQAEKMLAFYKEKEINPFSSILLLLVQIPVIVSLYLIFLRTELPEIQTDLLYDFVTAPTEISMMFMGVLDISGQSLLLALLAGATSFVQLRLSMPPVQEKKENPSFKDDLARNMNLQMRYIFPVILAVIAYVLSAVVALYLLTSNIFTIAQELYLKGHKKDIQAKQETTNGHGEEESDLDQGSEEEKDTKKKKKKTKKNKGKK